MKKELIFPLIVGLVLGVLVMLFWQLNVKMNSGSTRLAQLEQATNANTQAVSEIVGFINQATGQNGANAQAPAANTVE
jgi:CHASE3 domain sensor protein